MLKVLLIANALMVVFIQSASASVQIRTGGCESVLSDQLEVSALTSLTDMLDERGVSYLRKGNEIHILKTGLTPMNALAARVEAFFSQPLVLLENPTANDHPDHPYQVVYLGKLMVLMADSMEIEDILQMILNDTIAKSRQEPREEGTENL